MAAYTMPTYDALMQPTINALRTLGGKATNDDIEAYVIQSLAVPAEIAQQPHNGSATLSELAYRLMWTRTYLRRFGLIDSPRRGLWTLTEAGQQAISVDSREIVRVVRNLMEAERIARDGQAPIFNEEPVAEPGGDIPSTDTPTGLRSPTPLFPTYSNARQFLRILDSVSAAAYLAMAGAIWDQRGNPQEQVDWSNPDEWITQRLTGTNQGLAHRIWQESQCHLNPRYTRGCWYFVTKHRLLARGRDDILRITERGQQFLNTPNGLLDAEIDAYEGVLVVLHLVAEQGAARRSTLLPAFSEYSRTQTTFQSENVIKTSLYDRLRCLIDRALIVARGNSYAVTDAGLAYLERHAPLTQGHTKTSGKSADFLRQARSLRDETRSQLHAYLLEMDAFKFEELVKLLLEEMGYENVTTTSSTNDKGVDVVGTIELGISAVREVVQAKRHRGTINRPILDQLRGSLYRFDAVRGTIITTGRFSKGVEEVAFERGAPPITLIDGDKLLDLLLEYEIGVYKRQVDYYEFAPEKLAQFETVQEGTTT